MPNTISQFNVSFEAIHDRLILKVLTGNDEEVRLWLTRRYVQALFQTVADNQKRFMPVANTQPMPVVVEPVQQATLPKAQGISAVKAGANTQAQAQASSGSFSQSYQSTEHTALPYGKEPLLVSRITIKPQDGGAFNLILGEEQSGGLQIELNLNYDLLQSLMQLLQEACNSAQWGLHYHAQLSQINTNPESMRIH